MAKKQQSISIKDALQSNKNDIDKKPIDMTSYSEKLKHPKWQRKRLEIMNRDDFKCKLCNDAETTLNVHHLSYSKGDPWEIENDKLITICEDCHSFYERYKIELNINFESTKFVKLKSDCDKVLFVVNDKSIVISHLNFSGCLIYMNKETLTQIINRE